MSPEFTSARLLPWRDSGNRSQSASGDETPFFWLRESGAAKGPAV